MSIKILLTANVKEKSKRYSFDKMDTILKAQIDNLLDCGWKTEDVILIANIDYNYLGVNSTKVQLNDSCLTGSKMFSLEFVLDNGLIDDDVIWAKDLDTWPNYFFDAPKMKEVGITTYSTPKLNGGSVFWRSSAIDIVKHVIAEINKGEEKEEPTLNRLLKSEYRHRITILNTTYNVGSSGFFPRAYMADKPIKVCHFNPTNRIAWETHRLNRDGMNIVSVSSRLEMVLRKYYDLAYELKSKKDRERSKELRERHEKHLVRGKYKKRKTQEWKKPLLNSATN
jgi:hypothetical protein